MDPQHIERNSHLYDEILSELQNQGNMRPNNVLDPNRQREMIARKAYAKLDIAQMGVDLKENFK